MQGERNHEPASHKLLVLEPVAAATASSPVNTGYCFCLNQARFGCVRIKNSTVCIQRRAKKSYLKANNIIAFCTAQHPRDGGGSEACVFIYSAAARMP